MEEYGAELEQLENPFGRSFAMQRTPENQNSEVNVDQHSGGRRRRMSQQHAGEAPQTPAASRSTPPIIQKETTEREMDAMTSLGNKIQELVGMIVGGRRSVHQPMRDLITDIAELQERAAKDSRRKNMEGVSHRSVQTANWALAKETSKRPREEGHTARTTPPKKNRGKNAMAAPLAAKGAARKTPDKYSEVAKRQGARPSAPSAGANGTNVWTKVGPVKPKPKRRLEQSRPDALVIKAKNELSYADILRKVRSEPSLKHLGDCVQNVRRTQKGELLLQFKRTEQGSPATHKSNVEKALQEHVEVKLLRHEKVIEIKDIDEITTAEEVIEALEKQIPQGSLARVVKMRKAYGGTQIATISVQAKEAPKYLEMGKVRIGWTICRIKEKHQLVQCYKCLQYGHIARYCKNEKDMSKLCFRCGCTQHKAKDCSAEPRCLLCKDGENKDDKHAMGSRKCPYYQSALKGKLNKR